MRSVAAAWTRDSATHHDGTDAARAGAIGHDQFSGFETSVAGPDVLSFWWKVSSQTGDRLTLYLDGNSVESITGEAPWARRFLDVPDGEHLIRFEYAKDGGGTAGTDTGWVDELVALSTIALPTIVLPQTLTVEQHLFAEIPIAATQSPFQFAATGLPPGLSLDDEAGILSGVPAVPGDYTVTLSATNGAGTGVSTVVITVLPSVGIALNAPALDWANTDDTRWFSQTAVSRQDGNAAASGAISDAESTALETRLHGPGTLRFWWRVSSEQTFDALTFQIDAATKATVSGDVGWQQKTFAITSGPHTLRWEYAKDGSLADGLDRAWLDEVDWMPADNDNDGIADGWELEHFGNLSQTGAQDSDHDRQSNAAEEIAGTEPDNPASVFAVSSVTRRPTGLRIAWPSARGRTYSIERSDALGRWQPVLDGIAGSGGLLSRNVPAADGQWRVRVARD